MDSESLAQIQQIVNAATETIEARLGERIDEVQRHTGVLIEDVHHKLNLVIEGQQVLHREIANVRAEMQRESRKPVPCFIFLGLFQSEWVRFVIPAKAGIQYPP